jgi:hypothetical protein
MPARFLPAVFEEKKKEEQKPGLFEFGIATLPCLTHASILAVDGPSFRVLHIVTLQ